MRPLLARTLTTLLLPAALAACGPPCNQDHRCAVDGVAGQPLAVCNGDEYITCDEGNRGATIFCVSQPRKAICGAGGWAFESAPLASE